MEKEKRDKICLICYLIASMGFYANAIIGFINNNENNPVINICLGSTFLCLASTHFNKDNNKK